MPAQRNRANGEGSIFPYRNGYAAYVWVTKPDGSRDRKYVYGKTRDIVHEKWVELHNAARKGPVATKGQTVAAYLTYWLREVVKPNLKSSTSSTYHTQARLHIIPGLGKVRLDKLAVRDVRRWITELSTCCQCCAQKKDAKRPSAKQCCSAGRCCENYLSRRSVQDIRGVLRSALSNAIVEELITKNVAALVKVRSIRRRRPKPWTVEEARAFLESADVDGDPFYPAYVLVLVLGLRRGEVLGLPWSAVSLDAAELVVSQGLQRIDGRLVLGETKSEASDATLPLPGICVTALRRREKAQAADRAKADDAWIDRHGLVFTTRHGTPIEPRNFVRSFHRRCAKAGVRKVRVHDTRHTCGSLLAALDVHPRVVMQILRHSKIAVTMEIYTHVPDELTREALKRLGESFAGGPEAVGQ